ncbi:hypothetical protein [Niveispirillum fermenti]
MGLSLPDGHVGEGSAQAMIEGGAIARAFDTVDVTFSTASRRFKLVAG